MLDRLFARCGSRDRCGLSRGLGDQAAFQISQLGVDLGHFGIDAKVIGMNVVAPSLTVERIQKLAPKKDRAAWLAYLKRSEE